MQLYKHEPLNTGRNSFRLLKIHHELDPTRPIDLTLEVFDFDDDSRPVFQALSYVWGPPQPTGLVFINGLALSIRSNLVQFFYRMRGDKDACEQWLWVDQICINQAALGERNHQVSLMSKIYQQAREVVIWLGLDIRNSIWVFNNIASPERQASQRKSRSGPRGRIIFSAKELPYTGSFESLEYWHRLWICQEFIVARQITVIVGQTKLAWDDFDGFAENFGYRLRDLFDMRAKFKSLPSGLGWEMLFDLAMKASCQNPLDRVYGMMGLVREQDVVRVDYSLSTMELYILLMGKKIEMYGIEDVDAFHLYDHRCRNLLRLSFDSSAALDELVAETHASRSRECEQFMDRLREIIQMSS